MKERKQQQQSPASLQHQQQAFLVFLFSKNIYISKKKSRPTWSPLCCHSSVLASLFESAKEENLRTNAHTHIHTYKNTRIPTRHHRVLVRQTNNAHRLFVITIFILSSSSSSSSIDTNIIRINIFPFFQVNIIFVIYLDIILFER